MTAHVNHAVNYAMHDTLTPTDQPWRAREALETCLDRIADPQGEGVRVFLAVNAQRARDAADAADARRRDGRALGPLDGATLCTKDLFDLAGEVTRAASRATDDAVPAATTAPAVQRLLDAGMVLIGRTNMTEFAFSGLGLNPHHGTPKNPWDRATGRVPGGSSSGAAVAAADGMAYGALGTDTGGSCRIPAALCGVVGFKPTQSRIPRDHVFPLSATLDSVGPLAGSVAACALLDAVMAGEPPVAPAPKPLRGLTLPVLGGSWLEDLDSAVAGAFARALSRLSASGADVGERQVAAIEAVPQVNRHGGFAPAEAFALHRERLARVGDRVDPMVRARIERGATITSGDLAQLRADRARLIAEADAALADADAVLLPTCPIVAPPIALAEDPAHWGTLNGQLLRNCAWVNFLDRCAISLPCHAPGEPPVGLMLVGARGADAALFVIAAAVEAALHQDR